MTLYQMTKCYLSKLEANADRNSNLAHMVQFLFERVGNTVEKGENAGY